jgi:hypothetical protein
VNLVLCSIPTAVTFRDEVVDLSLSKMEMRIDPSNGLPTRETWPLSIKDQG